MSKIYDLCPEDVHERVRNLIAKHHPYLASVELKVDLLFVSTTGDGPALTLHGWPALAVVRIIGPKDRAAGRGDAEIVIDRDYFVEAPEDRKLAILDHELTHLQVKRDEDGTFLFDDHHRPRLKMRHHDVQIGWFAEIATRYGDFSVEREQGMKIRAKYGQTFFGFMEAHAETQRRGGMD